MGCSRKATDSPGKLELLSCQLNSVHHRVCNQYIWLKIFSEGQQILRHLGKHLFVHPASFPVNTCWLAVKPLAAQLLDHTGPRSPEDSVALCLSGLGRLEIAPSIQMPPERRRDKQESAHHSRPFLAGMRADRPSSPGGSPLGCRWTGGMPCADGGWHVVLKLPLNVQPSFRRQAIIHNLTEQLMDKVVMRFGSSPVWYHQLSATEFPQPGSYHCFIAEWLGQDSLQGRAMDDRTNRCRRFDELPAHRAESINTAQHQSFKRIRNGHGGRMLEFRNTLVVIYQQQPGLLKGAQQFFYKERISARLAQGRLVKQGTQAAHAERMLCELKAVFEGE